MKNIAIVGTGPTGIYTLYSMVENQNAAAITLYEQADEAGVGMPYAQEDNSRLMLANIASIEIPPLFSTYLDWLKQQDPLHLAHYGVQHASLHERQFLPRILLGEYYRSQFLQLTEQARQRGFQITVHESSEVTDLAVNNEGVKLWAGGSKPEVFDLVVLATGHVWPDDEQATRCYFPSPWSGLLEAHVDAGKVGIMGVSLSAIDAAMAVVAQHGEFVETGSDGLAFRLDKDSDALKIALLSRSGILPEADFYCPLPYEPLQIVTEQAIEREIAAGQEGLLDRVFALMVKEIEFVDPHWGKHISLRTLNADTFSEAWFADRQQHCPFHWAAKNLEEVERNKRDKHTVAWRYALLRLHEPVEDIVPHLSDHDRERFSKGLARVFIDNYTAIPSESIRRLLALRDAGILSIHALGQDYTLNIGDKKTVIIAEDERFEFATFIDARGQRPLKIRDLPFPSLRQQLAETGDDFPDVADDYTLLEPPFVRGRIACGALPYLLHDRPFVQGLTVCAEIGENIARAVSALPSRTRRRLPFFGQ